MFDPTRHHRRSIRLAGYDYSQAGAYFVTLCVQDRACLFGEIVGNVMRLNDAGHIVDACWQWLAVQYDHVELDAWVVMPNHLHGIIVLTDDPGNTHGDDGDDDGVGAWRRGGSRTAPTVPVPPAPPSGTVPAPPAPPSGTVPAPPAPPFDHPKRKPLGRLIGAFKTVSTKRINALRGTPGGRLWQRDFYERIIRDEPELNRIRQYIAENPQRWASDRNNPYG